MVLPMALMMIWACGEKDSSVETSTTTVEPSAVVENYADIVYANYQDALAMAERLQTEINAFLIRPNQLALGAAKTAWKDARIPYGQSEVFRFYNGPIDHEENGPEGLLNAWPMDEAYVDYVEGAPDAGIINDVETYPVINKALLESLNEKNGETNISTGYHAIEFLLWGQDFSESKPGQRPYTDYTTAANADRRGAYLRAVTELLIDHLSGLVDAWAPGQTDNYRARFLAQPSEDSLCAILTGMIELSGHELSGERMMVAYETQAQEDEHSCFSDNTHVDIVENARSIQNVYLGRYKRFGGGEVAGAGVFDLVRQSDSDLAKVIKQQIKDSLSASQIIPVPFDHTILGSDDFEGRKQIKHTIDLLRNQAETLQEAAETVGVQIPR